MATVVAGALLGMISTGAGAYLFGATFLGSVMAGAMIGYSVHNMLQMKNIDASANTPTYSFGPINNSKSQRVPIPLVYGGEMRVAGNIFYEKFVNEEQQEVIRYVGISAGVIDSIRDVKVGTELIEGADGCELETFLTSDDSTSSKFDPTGARPYPNNLAFCSMKLKAGKKINGSSPVTMIVRGRKVWTPDGVMFSTNPAWIIRDILTDKQDGCGIDPRRIDEDSFLRASRYYDEIVGDKPRFSLTYVVDTQRKLVDHIADMLACCRSMIITRDKISLYVDAPASIAPYKTIDESHVIEGSFTWWQTPEDEVFNRVTVEWIDPDNQYEQTVSVFEDSTDIAGRGLVEKTYSLLGITNAEQAGRMGAYLLDSAKYVRNFCSFQLSLKDADVEVMDIIGITHSLPGWENKNFRVITVTDVDNESDAVQIVCSEYIPEIYNDRAMDVTPHISTELDNPFNFDLRGFRARQAHDAKNKIILEWKPVISFAFDHYELREGETWETGIVLSDNTKETSYALTKQSDGIYHFMLKAVSTDGYSSKISYASITVVQLNPPKVTGVTATGSYRSISIHWDMPEDVEVGYFEIYSSTSADFSTATLAGRIYGTDYDFMGLGVMETRFVWVRAVSKYDPNIKSPLSDYATATTEALPEMEIPDASISDSKLQPSLSEKINFNPDENALNSIRHSLENDEGSANIYEEKTIRVEQNNLLVRKTEVLTAKTEENAGAIQETSEIVSGENGLTAQKFIKTDVNGNVAGYGLYNSGTDSEFTVSADKFYVGNGANKKPVFEVNGSTGDVNLKGGLIADGSITGEMINARSRINLAEGGAIVAGAGSQVQLGGGAIFLDSETGRMIIKDPNNLSTGNYVAIETGDITTYQQIDGAYRALKSLRVLEVGTANNGEPKTLTKRFPSAPDIFLSVRDTPIYNPAYQSSMQYARASITGFNYNESTGRCTFTPKITLATEGGTTNVFPSNGIKGYSIPNRGMGRPGDGNWWDVNSEDITFDAYYTYGTITLNAGITQFHLEVTMFAQVGGKSQNGDACWASKVRMTPYIELSSGGAYELQTQMYHKGSDCYWQILCQKETDFPRDYKVVQTVNLSSPTVANTTLTLKFRVRGSMFHGNARNDWFDNHYGSKVASDCSSHLWVDVENFTKTGASTEITTKGTVTYLAIAE